MFCDIIKRIRTSNGLTQKQLGEIVNVSQQAVGKWEKGIAEPDGTILTLLADHFNVTVDYLMGRSEEKNNPLTPEESERVNKFDELFSSLSEEQQKNAIDYMKFLLSNRAP